MKTERHQNSLTRFEALKRAVECYGSQEAMASDLGISQSTVSRLLNQSKQLPAEYVLRVEAATGVSRHHLRPDIYPVEVHALPPRFMGVDRGATRVSFNRAGVSKQGFAA